MAKKTHVMNADRVSVQKQNRCEGGDGSRVLD